MEITTVVNSVNLAGSIMSVSTDAVSPVDSGVGDDIVSIQEYETCK